MSDLNRARHAISHILKKTADVIKQDGFPGWQAYFADYGSVEVSLTYDDIKVLGEALKDTSLEQINARASTLGDLIRPKQIWMIRNLGRQLGLDADKECSSILHVPLEEISKQAASMFIEHLKQRQQHSSE
jgi:hypothetical protein